MKNITRTIALLVSACAILLAFQNCSGSSPAQPKQNEGSALQAPPPWEALSPAQATLSKVVGSEPSTRTDIQNALVDLRAALTKVQSIDFSSYGGSFRQAVLDLIRDLTAEINKLETALAALSSGGGGGGGSSPCSFNGQTIASGSSVTAYESSSVPYGQTCKGETRTCSNGQLSGSYTFAACAPQAQPSCQMGNTQWWVGFQTSIHVGEPYAFQLQTSDLNSCVQFCASHGTGYCDFTPPLCTFVAYPTAAPWPLVKIGSYGGSQSGTSQSGTCGTVPAIETLPSLF